MIELLITMLKILRYSQYVVIPQAGSEYSGHKKSIHKCDVMEYVHNIEGQQFISGTDFTRTMWITVLVMRV